MLESPAEYLMTERLKIALSYLFRLWSIWPNCLDIAYIKSASFGVKALPFKLPWSARFTSQSDPLGFRGKLIVKIQKRCLLVVGRYYIFDNDKLDAFL